jgi:hypothetical protein
MKELTLELLLGQRILVFVKVKEFLRNRIRSWLIIRVMIWLKIWVLKSIFNRDTLSRVKGKKLVKEIEGQVIDMREHDLPGNLLLEGKGADILASTAGLDTVVILHGWSTEHIKNKGKLMMVYQRVSLDPGSIGNATYNPFLGREVFR